VLAPATNTPFGAELFVARSGASTARSVHRLTKFDEPVDGDRAAVAANDQRIDVDADDVWACSGQRRQAQQDVGELLPVDGRLAPKLAE
jgi:hypothetical protein